MVVMCGTPSRWQRQLQTPDVNYRPLSVVMLEGKLYLETHVVLSASTHVAVSIYEEELPPTIWLSYR